MPRPPPSAPAASLPILAKSGLPTEQLTQIQRRLAHLLNSLAELQAHVSTAQSLEEWPFLLNRHLALASQTNSLTSFLALANPNTYNAQISHFHESLTSEALHHNKFSSEGLEGDVVGIPQTSQQDLLFSGSKTEAEIKPTSNLIKVQYTDDKNPLRRLAPHPFFPLESEKGQLVLPPLLLPKPDEQVLGEEEKRWKAWTAQNGVPEFHSKGQVEGDKACMEIIRQQIKEHDERAGQAIRSFIHAKEATDELGQRYDWKMRLDLDEASDEEEEVDDKGEDRKRKRDGEEEEDGKVNETTLTLDQVASFFTTGEL